MTLVLALAVLVGVLLGLLGGGGSILMVPLLVVVARLDARVAIPTSLLVVGTASLTALACNARRGHVAWRVGVLFGLASMAGAYAGGRLAHHVPSAWLLASFTGMMAITGFAMLRRRAAPEPAGAPAELGGAALVRAGVVGVGVGALTGLVGAGGGFVIVPALVLLAGLPMRLAVGSSLLVVSMNAFAGLAGALGHVSLDWAFAGSLAGATAAGSFVGATLAPRIAPARLRTGFAWLVIAMAAFLTYQQATPAVTHLIAADSPTTFAFTFPWLELAGGALIGVSASLLLLFDGRIAGISGIVGGLLRHTPGDTAWRAWFTVGLLLGGAALLLLAPEALGATTVALPLVALAGLLVGFGTRLGGGCTSGHGVCGIARLSGRSVVATLTFMGTGAVATFVVRHVLGGPR